MLQVPIAQPLLHHRDILPDAFGLKLNEFALLLILNMITPYLFAILLIDIQDKVPHQFALLLQTHRAVANQRPI